jgi:hypothetical protein
VLILRTITHDFCTSYINGFLKWQILNIIYFSIRCAAVCYFFYAHCVMADYFSTELNASDFRVIINHHCFALGEDCSS